jgi:hypothetical protein
MRSLGGKVDAEAKHICSMAAQARGFFCPSAPQGVHSFPGAAPGITQEFAPMFHLGEHQFDACLPRLTQSVRIRSLHDAQIFARRWVIRDKDPVLKALVRRLDRVRSGENAASALCELKSALAERGLLRPILLDRPAS